MSIYTAETIVEEGFRRAGNCLSPSQRVEASTRILAEVKHDIWTRTVQSGTVQFRSLAADSVMVLRPGQTRYQLPEDFDEVEHCHLLSGATVVTINGATAGGSATAALSEPVTTADVGKKLVWTSGPAEAFLQEVVGVTVGASYTLALSPAFEDGQTAKSGNTFFYVDRTDELNKEYMEEIENTYTSGLGRPYSYAINSERLQLDRPPDQEYAIRIRYYVNIAKVEEGSKIDQQINERWYSVLVKGVYWIASQKISDTMARDAYAQYIEAVEHLKWKEQDRGADESSIGFWRAETR